MSASSNPPVACTLDRRRYDEQLARNQALARHLIDRQRDGLRLTLTYPRSAAPDVHRIVADERECCAFIDFDVRESTDTIAVTLTLPEMAAASADEVFAQFAALTTPEPAPPRRVIRVAAVTAASGAVACGICCALPLAWPAVAAAGLGGVVAWLGRAQWEALLVATFIIGAAWTSVLWQTRRRAVQRYTGRREEPTPGSSLSDVSA